MKNRYRIKAADDGKSTYLFDDEKGGETVAVFVRNGHEEDAAAVAEMLNHLEDEHATI